VITGSEDAAGHRPGTAQPRDGAADPALKEGLTAADLTGEMTGDGPEGPPQQEDGVTTLAERTGIPSPRPGRFAAMVVVTTPAIREAVMHTLRALGARQMLEVGTVAEAKSRAAAGIADLCIAEAGLPDGSGITLIRDLRAAGWTRGMVLTTSDDPYSVRAAITAGVRCYLVSAVAGGPQRAPGTERSDGVDSLSARELQVLQLVAEGKSNKDIGVDLGLSALTVKSHLARIARKLGTGDRAEMVATALRSGAIS
jgi:DNA-binding NarL/FixJ family response regulator